MCTLPDPPAVTPTPTAELDRMLDELEDRRMAWVRLSPAERAALLRRCMKTTLAVADKWAAVSARIKGYAQGSNGHGEEYLAGTLPVMRNLRLFAEALDAGGMPAIPRLSRSVTGQWVARVFPQSTLDGVMMTGITCDIWVQPDKTPTQGSVYRRKASGDVGEGGVCAVLGAGNQSSIPPMDVLYKLVVDDEVCILKMNPVNEQLGPIIAEALAPLVDAGFLRMAYGGIEQGKHLTDHELVTSIHITGSARAHDAIIWGPGEAGERNKEAGTPRLDKHITSELGCVSPVLVVPGRLVGRAELDYHARQVASMLAYNCGFNCNGARLIVMAKGWKHREPLRAAGEGQARRHPHPPRLLPDRPGHLGPLHREVPRTPPPWARSSTSHRCPAVDRARGRQHDEGEYALSTTSPGAASSPSSTSTPTDAAEASSTRPCPSPTTSAGAPCPSTSSSTRKHREGLWNAAKVDQAIADLRYGASPSTAGPASTTASSTPPGAPSPATLSTTSAQAKASSTTASS